MYVLVNNYIYILIVFLLLKKLQAHKLSINHDKILALLLRRSAQQWAKNGSWCWNWGHCWQEGLSFHTKHKSLLFQMLHQVEYNQRTWMLVSWRDQWQAWDRDWQIKRIFERFNRPLSVPHSIAKRLNFQVWQQLPVLPSSYTCVD